MSRSRQSLVLLALVAVLAGGAWRMLGERDARSVRAGSDVARPARAGSAAADLAASGGPAPAPDPRSERGSVAPVQAAPEPPAPAWEEGFEATAVYGTVIDGDGRPIEGARCLLFPVDYVAGRSREPALASCATRADGRFRFRELEPWAQYRVYADADGFLPALSELASGTDREIELREAAPMRGRVTDAAGRPVEGVVVALPHLAANEEGVLVEEVASTTDAEGRYALAHARTDRTQRVHVRRPPRDGVPALRETREFQVQVGRPEGYDVRLAGELPVTLFFYDLETGKPVTGLELEISGGVTVVPDARGLAQVALADPGRDGREPLDLRVEVEGWCRTVRTLEVPEGGFARAVELPLLRGARVRGVVTGPDGPVEGARVAWRSPRRRLEGFDLPPRTSISTAQPFERTGADGRFELSAILPSTAPLTVHASAKGLREARSGELFLTIGAAAPDLELRLGRGGAIRGVVTRNGAPIRARVWATGPVERETVVGAANDRGEYVLEGIEPGQVTLSVHVDDRGWIPGQHTETVAVVEGEATVHDVDLVERRATIAGRVVEDGGRPLAGVAVHSIAESGEGSTRAWIASDARTDDAGRFAIEVKDEPGVVYALWVSEGERHARRSGVPVGAQDVELVLPRPGRLALEVVDAATREHVERFRVYWRESGGDGDFRLLGRDRAGVVPGPGGVFEAELPAGVHDLRVCAREDGYLDGELSQVRVSDGARIARVALDRGVTLEIRFVGPDPERRPRVTLVTDEQRAVLARALDSYSAREIRDAQRARPDREGNAVLRGMPPGRYTLWSPPRDIAFEPTAFEVPPVDRHSVELTWRPATPEGEAAVPEGTEALLQGLGYFVDD